MLVFIISYILPIILFVTFCFRRATRGLWVIFFYLLLSMVLGLVQKYTTLGKQIYFLTTGLFTIFEFAMFVTFYFLNSTNTIIKRLYVLTSVAVLLFLIYNFLRSDNKNFDSISASIESITLIVFSVIYFFEQISKPEPTIIYSTPTFWIVLAILLYMSSTLFLFIMANNLPQNLRDKYWTINKVSNLISSLIICIAFVLNRKTNLEANSSLEKPSFDYSNIPEKP